MFARSTTISSLLDVSLWRCPYRCFPIRRRKNPWIFRRSLNNTYCLVVFTLNRICHQGFRRYFPLLCIRQPFFSIVTQRNEKIRDRFIYRPTLWKMHLHLGYSRRRHRLFKIRWSTGRLPYILRHCAVFYNRIYFCNENTRYACISNRNVDYRIWAFRMELLF